MKRRSPLSIQRDRQKPSSQTWRQMRSALAGTASNVVALKTTAAVPKSVIERIFSTPLLVSANKRCNSHRVPRKQFELHRTFFEFLETVSRIIADHFAAECVFLETWRQSHVTQGTVAKR